MFFLFHNPDGLPSEVRDFLRRDTLSWDEFEGVLHYFRHRRPELTIGAMLTFLYIARRCGSSGYGEGNRMTISEVANGLNLSYPSAAKHCDVLSTGYGSRLGLAWIVKEEGEDKRMRTVRLAADGIDFLTNLVEELPNFRLPHPEG